MMLDKYDPESPMGKALAEMQGVGTEPAEVPAMPARPAPSQPGMIQLLAESNPMIGPALRTLRTEGMPNPLDALDIPRELMLAPFGGAQNVDESFARGQEWAASNPFFQGIMRGMPGGGLLENPTTAGIAFETLTDPMSYVGGPGHAIGGQLAKAGGKVGAVGTKIANADDLISNAMGAAARATIEAGQLGLAPVNAQLAKYMPSLEAWTDYAMRTRVATDVTEFLEVRGMDFANARGHIDEAYDLLPGTLKQRFTKNDLKNLVITNTQAADWDEALTDWSRQLRDDMGIGRNGGKLEKAGDLYNTVVTWWSRQALASVANPVTNLLGGMVGAATQGISPVRIARDVADNWTDIIRANPFHLDDATRISDDTGIPIPYAVDQQTSATLNNQFGASSGYVDAAKRDGVILGVLGALGEGGVGAIVGGLSGSVLGPFAQRIREVNRGIETVLRERGFVEGMSRELVESAAEMEGIVRQAMTNPRARTATGRKGTVPADVFADVLANQVTSSGGRISSEEIANTMRSSVFRMPEDIIETTVREIDDVLYRAAQKGQQTSTAYNFDYEDLSAIERAIKNVSPFSTWFMKAVPYYAEQGAQNPWAVQLVRDWYGESAEEQEEAGLTNRVSGAQPNDFASQFASALLGRPVELWMNPVSSLVPFGDIQRGLDRASYTDNPLGKGLAYAEALGFGTNPFVGAGLRILGVGDDDEPAAGIGLRAGGVIQGLTGVDLEKAPRKIEEGIREALPGRGEVGDIGDIMIERRVDELAIRERGVTTSQQGTNAAAEYLRAKQSHSGPIWERAKKEIAQERGIQAGIGFISNQARPQAIVTKEEGDIRKAQSERIVPEEIGRRITELGKSEPDAMAPGDIQRAMWSSLDAISARTGEPIPQAAIEAMTNPTVAEMQWLSTEIFKWEASQNPLVSGYRGSGSPEQRQLQNELAALQGGATTREELEVAAGSQSGRVPRITAIRGAQSKAKSEILAQSPLLREYLAWKEKNPTGTIPDFLAQRPK